MNATPHTHEPKITKCDGPGYKLTYGDTKVRFLFASERSVAKALRKAVRLHDKGSVKAGDKQTTVQTLQKEATMQISRAVDDVWGTDVLTRKEKIPEKQQFHNGGYVIGGGGGGASATDEVLLVTAGGSPAHVRVVADRREEVRQEIEAQKRRRDTALAAARLERWRDGIPDVPVQVDYEGMPITENITFGTEVVERPIYGS